MSNRRLYRSLAYVILALVLYTGCGAPATSPDAPHTVPPPSPSSTILAPSPYPALIPSWTPAQPVNSPRLFKFIQSVQVTPDANFLTGAFSRINYVPATDRFIVTFGGEPVRPSGSCTGKVFAYKEYTTGMQETGKSGIFSCDVADAGSVMVDNTYYFAAMSRNSEQVGWHLLKIDVASWKTRVDSFIPLDYPKEGDADPMVAYVNGQLDISSAYNASGKPPDPSTPAGSYGTHHQLFSADLQFLGKKILTDPPHINGSSMVFVDGVYYLVTANLFDGDVLVAKYDKEWNYLGEKILIKQAHWSTGLVYDNERFYLAYTDTWQRTDPGFFPVHLNIRLAAFDRDWNLLEDVAVTDFAPSDHRQPGRPWVVLQNNRLYVSYDVDTIDPVTQQEQLKWQAYVSVYELTPPSGKSARSTEQSGQTTNQTSTCPKNDLSTQGVLRSTDHGATWTSLGNACIHNLKDITPADPTPLMVNGRIVLYFVDLGHLDQPVPQSIYCATSVDGVNFDPPQPAYTQAQTMVDPFVLRLSNGSFRLYAPSGSEGIISAMSGDCLTFKREEVIYLGPGGGMPGALLLPDGRVRLFVDGGPDSQGLISMISSDGLSFTSESGVRIPKPPDYLTLNNPEPIRLKNGSYLMLYQTQDKKHEGRPEWEAEIHLAISKDGFNWTPDPKIIGYGGTSGVIELPDGTLLIYYGTR
jgi:hypothetical protein